MSRAILYCGDAREVLTRLPNESVQCCVTSVPYWGLRSYGTVPQVWGGNAEHAHNWQAHRYYVNGGAAGRSSIEAFSQPGQANSKRIKEARWREDCWCKCGAWRGELGLEPAPELYVEHMVTVFRGVWRVLRKDGVLWLNIGDSYASTGRSDQMRSPKGTQGQEVKAPGRTVIWGKERHDNFSWTLPGGIKPKDLVGIPWMLTFALRADGWWLRSDVIWAKPNPMPESVTDRPTRSHEYLFLLSKSERYYYDSQAIAEALATDPREDYPARSHIIGRDGLESLEQSTNGQAHQRSSGGFPPRKRSGNLQRDIPSAEDHRGIPNTHLGRGVPWEDNGNGRNARSVWTIATQPYPSAHFATFPEELARRCIVAGSSPKACEHCGAPWERVTERDGTGPTFAPLAIAESGALPDGRGTHRNMGGRYQKWLDENPKQTTGWLPTCECRNDGTGRSVVLDPFGGSGTVAQVATGNGRDSIYIDLNPKYLELARQRIGPMLCDGVSA